MDTRTGSSFVLSTAALVVALAAFITQQTGVGTAPATATVSTAAPATPIVPTTGTATATATVTTTDTATATIPPSPLTAAADAYVAMSGAQTERFKAETARIKDRLEHTRLMFTAECDCYYKFALLGVAFLIVLLLQRRIRNLTFFGVIIDLGPAPVPPPPPATTGVLAAADTAAPPFHIVHTVARGFRPRFLVELEGATGDVREVRYYLHPRYGTTVPVVTAAPFTLDIPALGKFLLYADVTKKDGNVVRLQRYLDA